jgi:cell division protein FtsB
MNRISSRRPLVLLLLIGGCVLFMVGYIGRLGEQARLRAEVASLEARIAATQRRQAELNEQLAYAQSDAYIHKEAREALNLVLPGDELIVVVEETPASPVEPAAAEPDVVQSETLPNWQQWLELFLPRAGSS